MVGWGGVHGRLGGGRVMTIPPATSCWFHGCPAQAFPLGFVTVQVEKKWGGGFPDPLSPPWVGTVHGQGGGASAQLCCQPSINFEPPPKCPPKQMKDHFYNKVIH